MEAKEIQLAINASTKRIEALDDIREKADGLVVSTQRCLYEHERKLAIAEDNLETEKAYRNAMRLLLDNLANE